MTYEERSIGDVTIVDVTGRMTADAPSDVRLNDAARSLVERGRTRIVVNLERMAQLDSAGLCDLVMAYTTATRRGGSLKLLHPTPRVRDLLVLTKLLTVLRVFDSEAEAVASFDTDSSL